MKVNYYLDLAELSENASIDGKGILSSPSVIVFISILDASSNDIEHHLSIDLYLLS